MTYLPEICITWCVLIYCNCFDAKPLALKHLGHSNTSHAVRIIQINHTCVVWRRLIGDIVMDIESRCSRMGIRIHMVFPLPVPAIMMLSCWWSIAREAWSWKVCGTTWASVRNDTIRQARSASSWSSLFNVARYSWGRWSLIKREENFIASSRCLHWRLRWTEVTVTSMQVAYVVHP